MAPEDAGSAFEAEQRLRHGLASDAVRLSGAGGAGTGWYGLAVDEAACCLVDGEGRRWRVVAEEVAWVEGAEAQAPTLVPLMMPAGDAVAASRQEQQAVGVGPGAEEAEAVAPADEAGYPQQQDEAEAQHGALHTQHITSHAQAEAEAMPETSAPAPSALPSAASPAGLVRVDGLDLDLGGDINAGLDAYLPEDAPVETEAGPGDGVAVFDATQLDLGEGGLYGDDLYSLDLS
jgi:hypothetical protein